MLQTGANRENEWQMQQIVLTISQLTIIKIKSRNAFCTSAPSSFVHLGNSVAVLLASAFY
ncbi:MAG: hypothetical protein MJZ65_03755 [Paludibacteraceae bacterium]|nr:hypothetical protein [Paludibacteraceae bacterium]